MSIYESSVNEKSRASSVKDIRNNKDLTSLVKQMRTGPKTAKEILFDHDDNVIGILQRNDTPYFFSSSEHKDFLSLAEA